MAHAQEVGSLLDQLILAHRGDISDDNVVSFRRSALQTLSSNKGGRTNQFEIHARLEGLAEKLRILNKDDIAELLEGKIGQLMKHDWTWGPETLSLLLILSNRPAQRLRVENHAIDESDTPPVPPEWSESDLDASNSEDTGLWKNVDFVNEGSDEESDVESTFSENHDLKLRSSTPTESFIEVADSMIVHIQRADFKDLYDVYWLGRGNGDVDGLITSNSITQNAIHLTELQAIREVIYMLLGLPTTVFKEVSASAIQPCKQVTVYNVSRSSIKKMMEDFAVIGGDLRAIRGFTKSDQGVPLTQTFQALISQSIQALNAKLDSIQAAIIGTHVTCVASLLQFYEDVYQTTRLIRRLIPVLQHVIQQPEILTPFSILEGLYDNICAMHSTGETESYEYLADIFFPCFQAYLKPISLWMENADLDEHESIMFIRRNDTDIPLHSLWQDQFSLVRVGNGLLRAPRFLQLAARKIFNIGKSVYFLKKLGDSKGSFGAQDSNRLQMSFNSVCRQADPFMLSPFPALFDTAFDSWIASRHTSSSSMLRQRLEENCSLQSSLDALEYVFFSKGGILSSNVLSPIFERLDGGKRHWNDAFVLTEIYQDAFKAVWQVDVNGIGIRSSRKETQRSMSVLKSLNVSYRLPWPVANIIRPSSEIKYQRVFTFLAQAHRAKFLLQRHKLPTLNRRKADPHLYQIYSLRSQLLYFVNTLLTHITILVIDVCTVHMRHSMAKADDVDAMVSVHTEFIGKVEEQCLLTKQHSSLKQAVVAILDLTILFSDIMSQMDRGGGKSAEKWQPEKLGRRSGDSSEDDDTESPLENPCIDRETGGEQSNASPHKIIEEKLTKVRDTYTQLHSFVVANVRGLSKTDGAACWEIWASNLEAGKGS